MTEEVTNETDIDAELSDLWRAYRRAEEHRQVWFVAEKFIRGLAGEAYSEGKESDARFLMEVAKKVKESRGSWTRYYWEDECKRLYDQIETLKKEKQDTKEAAE